MRVFHFVMLPAALVTGAAVLAGCSGDMPASGGLFSSKNYPPATQQPMRWDAVAHADGWTGAVVAALEEHGTALVATVPADVAAWCPAYPRADAEGRKAFWAGLLSTLAKHESTWNPSAVGGGGRWFGLVQISPATARDYGCAATSPGALKDGPANLSCAVRIMNVTVPRDGVISEGMRGAAADWGPFHSAQKRRDMIGWLHAQPYCSS